MPPTRLAELRRQRALVQEHLAWLEREIAAADQSSATAIPANPPPPTEPSLHPVAKSPTAAKTDVTPADARIDDILAQYRSAPGSVKQDVRKGCLLYFTLALGVLAALVAVLYFALGPR